MDKKKSEKKAKQDAAIKIMTQKPGSKEHLDLFKKITSSENDKANGNKKADR